MKVALIGDVHANLPALEAVAAHARENGAEAFWNIGDFVGYNAFPDETVSFLRRLGAVSIIGNYDEKVLKVKQKREKWARTKAPQKFLAFEWAYDHLSPENRDYLRSLPERMELTAAERRVLLVHGSPASPEEPLTPETPDERLRELAAMEPAEIIIFGHSHQPFTRKVDETWFINTGSVGRPDDGDPRAAYALLSLGAGEPEVKHYRIEYEVERAAQAILTAGLPEEFAQMVREGRSLDGLQAG